MTLLADFTVLHVLEVQCNKIGIKVSPSALNCSHIALTHFFAAQALIKKLYREFMIMGFISFAILFASETSDFHQDKW